MKLILGLPFLMLAFISISIPAAFGDTIVGIDDAFCHVGVGDPPPMCDVLQDAGPVLTGVLDDLGFDFSSDTDVESVSTVFAVDFPAPDSPLDPPVVFAEVKFNALFDGGAFDYSFGYCKQSLLTGIDPENEKEQYATACLCGDDPDTKVLFEDQSTDEDLVSPDMTTVDVCASGCDLEPGAQIRFWLLPDNDVDTFCADPSQFYPPQTDIDPFRAPLFQLDTANPGEFDQLLTFLGAPGTVFSWEDLSRTSITDEDFEDLVFSTDTTLKDVCGIQNPPLTGDACDCFIDPSLEKCDLMAGEYLAVDSSALLLAGFQTSAVWILPLIIAGAGIVAFQLRRK